MNLAVSLVEIVAGLNVQYKGETKMIDKIYQFQRFPPQDMDEIESAVWLAKWYWEDCPDDEFTAKYNFIYGLLEELFYEMYSNDETNYSEPDYPDFAKYFSKKLDVWQDGYIADKHETNEGLYLICCKIICDKLTRLQDDLLSIDGMINRLKIAGCDVNNHIGTKRCISIGFNKEQIGVSIYELSEIDETIEDLINIYNSNVDKINDFYAGQRKLQRQQIFDAMQKLNAIEQERAAIAKSEEKKRAEQVYQQQIKDGLMNNFMLLYTTSGNRRYETIIHRDDIISVKPSINPEYIDITLDDDTIICVDAEYLETINNIIKEKQ
jgi:hypothetical protein